MDGDYGILSRDIGDKKSYQIIQMGREGRMH